MRFESTDPSCTLADYVTNPAVGQRLAPRILWLSDSVDHEQLTSYCERHLKGKMVMHSNVSFEAGAVWKASMGQVRTGIAPEERFMWCHTCDLSGTPYNRTKLMSNWMVSTGKAPPFWANMPLGGWHKVLDSEIVWRSFSTHPPDMIVTATTLWEMGRFTVKYPQNNNPNGAERFSFQPGLMEEWIREYTELIEVINTVFPGVPILHRAHYVRHHNDPHMGDYTVGILGSLPQFHQLNAAGVYAATAQGLEVWPWADTFHQIRDQSTIFKDDVHLQWWLSPDILNIYMNYAARYRSLHGSYGSKASHTSQQ